jgi:hypothetical protein
MHGILQAGDIVSQLVTADTDIADSDIADSDIVASAKRSQLEPPASQERGRPRAWDKLDRPSPADS